MHTLYVACVSDSAYVTAADAAKKDPEQFKIWREDPANFSFEGRYPLQEVYDKAAQAWKGMSVALLLYNQQALNNPCVNSALGLATSGYLNELFCQCCLY